MRRNAPQEERLAEALGWASLGLGVPQLAMPGRFDRAIGVDPDMESRAWTVLVGVRELAAAAGLLTGDRRSRAMWTWGRVAGDVKDLTLLATALRGKPESRTRLAMSMGAVVGIMALDVYTAMRLSRTDESVPDDSAPHPRGAVTVRSERDEVERRWREFHEPDAPAWLEGAEVRFDTAPGDRGTEVHVNLDGGAREGRFAKAMPKVAARLTGEELKDDLRRFKQSIEAGTIVRSEGTPEGPRTVRFLKQRPAQPLGEHETGAGARS